MKTLYYYPSFPPYNTMPICSCGRKRMWCCQQQSNYFMHQGNMQGKIVLKDYGKQPFVININEAAQQNQTFRTALWTGAHLQVTVMNIGVGEDIGLEVHPNTDQFLRIEKGQGLVQMGNAKNNLTFRRNIADDDAVMVPAGTWHNITNTGNIPLQLYTIYAPPEHPFGTVHRTKAEAIAAEDH